MHQRRETSNLVQLRKAIPSDGQRVLWLEKVCMEDYAIALWGAWRPAQTLESLDLANHEMIEVGGVSEGCLETRLTADAIQLTRLFLAPDARNRGIGAQVLQRVIRRAHRRDLGVRLSVLTTNPAVKFYMRHGFIVECSTPERHHMFRPSTPQTKE